MGPVEGPWASLPYVHSHSQLSSRLIRVFRVTYCELTVTESDTSPVAVTVIVMFPVVKVELTMARALPLNALRLVPLYDDVSMALPLSTPTSAPGSAT